MQKLNNQFSNGIGSLRSESTGQGIGKLISEKVNIRDDYLVLSS